MATSGAKAALPDVAAYAARNWWHLDSHLMLARLLAASKDYPAAVAAYQEAATLDIHCYAFAVLH